MLAQESTNENIKLTIVGIKKITIPAITRKIKERNDVFISSSFEPTIALKKSIIPNAIIIIGIIILTISTMFPINFSGSFNLPQYSDDSKVVLVLCSGF